MKLFSSFSLLVGSEALDLSKFLMLQQHMNTYKGNSGDPAQMSDFLNQINAVNGSKRESWSQQINPMQILMGGSSMTGIDKDTYVQGMKDQMMNKMFENMNGQQLSPLLLQYASGGGIDKEQILYQSMEEPMGTIMRLKKNGAPKAQDLLKKWIAIKQFGDDPILPDLFVSGDKDGIKQYMMSKQLETMGTQPGGDFMKTLLWRKMTGKTDDPDVSNKELIAASMFAGKLDQNGASVKPNDAYLMFKFLKMQTSQNGGKVPASTILEVALGDDVASIKAQDFEQLFGVDQQEFICMAHESSIRVPCLVNQATVTDQTCPQHCCFNPTSSDGSQHDMIPICYHNLLGKIGAGIAKHMINENNIKNLFGSKGLPTLTDLTDAADWAEAQMPEVLRRINKDEGEFYGMPAGQGKWWENTYNSDEGKFNIYASAAPKTVTSGNKWKPHGPTALPYEAFVPETGEFGVGREGSDPLISLDQIINAEVEATKAKLNSDSYTCRLIPKEHMINCFATNYDALSGLDPAASCATKGCCYNENNLFEGNPVCFRSLRAGYCDPYGIAEGPGAAQNAQYTGDQYTKANQWWAANPKRVACGEAVGGTQMECELNPQCCYSENPRISGDPVCYHRGGAESVAASGSLTDNAMCFSINVAQREACFTNNKFGTVLNKIATQEQCELANCCYDAAAAEANKDFGGLLGGSIDLTGPHCFKKNQEMLDSSAQADGASLATIFRPSDLMKTCDDTRAAARAGTTPNWPQLLQNKWVKDPITGDWKYETSGTDKRPAIREQCDATGDQHACVYELGCCFEKSADPREPWCYKPRYVKKP